MNTISIEDIFSKVTATIFSWSLLYVAGFLVFILIITSHIIWLAERRTNPDFPSGYFPGIWEAFWWSAVTLTTVGYGDKTPKAKFGRLFAIFWMISGYFVFAYFTASVTTTTTVQHLEGTITGPGDFTGKHVASVEKSIAKEFLTSQGVTSKRVQTVEEAYELLENEEVEAVIHDSAVLQYYAAHTGLGKVKTMGPVFQEQNYGIALPYNSPHREALNRTLLTLFENGTCQKIYEKWFGSENE